MGKVVIVSAPSGAGKTTLVKYLLETFPELEFSVSACSRTPRAGEVNGKDYYFITAEEFKKRIDRSEFIEWEEVYPNQFYGTLKAEIQRIWDKGHIVLFDVDVKGGINLKNIFQHESISVFISPPNLNVLEQRLRNRGTESEETLRIRIEKAQYELSFKDKFDYVVVNDTLEEAKQELYRIVNQWIKQ